jgi:DNA-binding XRE family transcriptional regulator
VTGLGVVRLVDITGDLGNQVKAQRIRLDLSQREAAERIGISERTLQNWEAGSTFPLPKHRHALDCFLREDNGGG